MANLVVSNRYTGAQTDTAQVTAAATQKIYVKAVHLSVPAGQNAQIKLGSTVVCTTEGSLNLPAQFEGGLGDDLTVTSSGAVSVAVVYQIGTR